MDTDQRASHQPSSQYHHELIHGSIYIHMHITDSHASYPKGRLYVEALACYNFGLILCVLLYNRSCISFKLFFCSNALQWCARSYACNLDCIFDISCGDKSVRILGNEVNINGVAWHCSQSCVTQLHDLMSTAQFGVSWNWCRSLGNANAHSSSAPG